MAMLFAVATAAEVPLATAAEEAAPDPSPSPAPAHPPGEGVTPSSTASQPEVETPAGAIPEVPTPTPPPFDPDAPLEAGDRDTLLRLAWRTLVGHLTGDPIRTDELERFDLTPALLAPHGCFVTVLKEGATRGLKGEVDATRPLYQQAIIWTRRAATGDPRFPPLTDLDLAGAILRIEVIGKREPISGPEEIGIGHHGILLEKWGRRALFLPDLLEQQKWTPSRALDELCKQAALPIGAWSQGARLEVFTTQVIEGAEPPPPPPDEVPDGESTSAPAEDGNGAEGAERGSDQPDARPE